MVAARRRQAVDACHPIDIDGRPVYIGANFAATHRDMVSPRAARQPQPRCAALWRRLDPFHPSLLIVQRRAG